MAGGPDYELEALLSLDGYEFRFAKGYAVKFEVRLVNPTRGVRTESNTVSPFMTRTGAAFTALTTPTGLGRGWNSTTGTRTKRKVVRYAYRGPIALLDDFFHAVEWILHERGVS